MLTNEPSDRLGPKEVELREGWIYQNRSIKKRMILDPPSHFRIIGMTNDFT